MKTSARNANPLVLEVKGSVNSYPIEFSEIERTSKALINVWKQQNALVTIGHIFGKLNELNYISNLRAVRDSSIARKGMWFSDSDVFKSLEAAIWSSQDDPTLLSRVNYDEIIEVIAQAQDSDGYINSWFQISAKDLKWKDFASGHEMYTAGHLFQAGVAEARVLGQGTLYGVAIKFADLLVSKFGGETPYVSDGHPEVETALIELSRESKNKAYLDLAEKMLEGRGRGIIAKENTGSFHLSPPIYIQDHMSIRKSDKAVGHCVRQMYLNLGVMDLYFELNDPELLAIQEAMWNDVTHTKMYVTGGVGSRHRDESFGDSYELPNDRAYAETCASIAYFMWNWKLLLATGNSKYADLMEVLIYNIIAGSMSEDYERFFYSNPLHRRKDHLAAFDEESSERMPWYRVSCCPPNIGRLVGSIDSYVASDNRENIYLHQFISGSFKSEKFAPWGLTVETHYPSAFKIEIAVTEISDQNLLVRLPKWAKSFEISKNGKPAKSDANTPGYIGFSNLVKGDVLVISLSAELQYVQPHPLLDAARGTVAIQKGPLLFALDQSANPHIGDIERCEISVDSKFTEIVKVDSHGVEFTIVEANGVILDISREETSFTTDGAGISRKPVTLNLIPYSRWGNPVSGGMRVWIPTS